LINDNKNPLSEIFDPLRFKQLDYNETLNEEQLELAQKFQEDKIQWPEDLKISELYPGESVVIEDKFSVYKDDNGKIHRLQAICSHMGCLLVWNDAEKTWDCPCHGARFNHQGKVIHGPAVVDLKKY
jgi:Rieske Fe-S protein